MKKINMSYLLYIFDLDGTILDTLTDLANAVNYTMNRFGFATYREKDVADRTGNGIARLVRLCLPENADENTFKTALGVFKEYYVAHCADNTKPYVDIKNVISELKARGAKCAVISNKADEAVQKLAKDYFYGLFDAVVGQKEGVRVKPYPDTVENVLNILNVPREKTVYIGDSEVDIMTARNAEIKCLSVAWGFRSEDFLIENGADVIIHSPKEILNY